MGNKELRTRKFMHVKLCIARDSNRTFRHTVANAHNFAERRKRKVKRARVRLLSGMLLGRRHSRSVWLKGAANRL